MQEWEVKLDQLTNSGVIGAYHYCKVNQIVLFDKKTGIAWNYFTHVHFSGSYDTETESTLLTSPTTLQNGLQLFVSQYSMQKIELCCLTDIHTISHNKGAKAEILTGDTQAAFDEIRNSFQKELEDGLGQETDLRLSFRTVHGNNGSSFHDRYLILKYQLNKTRVWSLGTSVNSVGKSHHIVQIVESPILIDTFFNEVWSQTDTDKCKIYDYSDYAAVQAQDAEEPQVSLDSAVDKG